MANPQTENGYTPIANEIYEALIRIRIPGEARQVLDFIIRKTYGYHKKEDAISLSQFALATGMRRPDVVRAINKLITMNLISKKANRLCKIYRFNKDFDTWKVLAKKRTVRNVSKKANRGVSEKANLVLAKKRHTKDIYTKDIYTKDNNTKEIAEPCSAGEVVNNLIDCFKGVNPNHEQLFKNKTERSATERMLKKFGEEKLRKTIDFLQAIIGKPYAPIITTPVQLERKLGALIAYYRKEQEKGKGIEIIGLEKIFNTQTA